MGNVIDWESMLKNVELADHAPEEHLCESCEHSLICTIEAEWEGLVYECPYYLKRIVHCGECEYYKEAKVNKKGYLICPASGMEITERDFCSYGERREE